MKLFKWLKGRQGYCNYKKFCFLHFSIFNWGIDGYILKYEPYAILPAHKDEVEDARHWRLNIILKGIGYFRCSNTIINWFRGRIILFRPDINEHMMVNSEDVRYVLSFGFIIKNK